MSARSIMQVLGVLAGSGVALYSLVGARAWLAAAVIAGVSAGGLWAWRRALELDSPAAADRLLGWLLAASLGYVVIADALVDARAEQHRSACDPSVEAITAE